MSKVKVEKIEIIHPSDTSIGFFIIGNFHDFPKIGERFRVGAAWSTSTVVEIINYNTIKTLNSVYRITLYEE